MLSLDRVQGLIFFIYFVWYKGRCIERLIGYKLKKSRAYYDSGFGTQDFVHGDEHNKVISFY
jgi:hypothetical protein